MFDQGEEEILKITHSILLPKKRKNFTVTSVVGDGNVLNQSVLVFKARLRDKKKNAEKHL